MKYVKAFASLLILVASIMYSTSISASKAASTNERAIKLEKKAEQMIAVKPSKTSKTSATLQRYVKKNGKWVKVSTPVKAVIGKKGMGKMKEGDAKTPVGTYSLGKSFGWGKKPAGIKSPFKKVTKHDYWVDDVKSKDYNKWVHYKGKPNKRWNSYERLTHPLYKYGVVIRYNEDPIVKGAGSAVFLHMKTSKTKYTLGCVAISEKDLVKVLKWLDPKKDPIIKIKK